MVQFVTFLSGWRSRFPPWKESRFHSPSQKVTFAELPGKNNHPTYLLSMQNNLIKSDVVFEKHLWFKCRKRPVPYAKAYYKLHLNGWTLSKEQAISSKFAWTICQIQKKRYMAYSPSPPAWPSKHPGNVIWGCMHLNATPAGKANEGYWGSPKNEILFGVYNLGGASDYIS